MSDSIPGIPAHVRPELVVDFDYFKIEAVDGDIHQGWYQALRKGPEIFYTPRNGGHWVATRGEDIELMYRDHQRFSSIEATIPKEGKPIRLPLFEMDPPDHTVFRVLLAPAFSPKAIAAIEPRIRALTVELIEGFEHRGECEFMEDFAKRMPIGIFLMLADLPLEDSVWLLPLVDEATRVADVQVQTNAFAKVLDYLSALVEQRRGKKAPGLIAKIANAEIQGKPLSHDDALGLCTLLMMAGLDTVVASLGFFARHLALHSKDRQRLSQNMEQIPGAVDELLRRYGVSELARTIRNDIKYKGVTMRAGDMVLLPTLMHGLDERLFERPEEVDFARTNKAHLTFGSGIHRCIGAFLARTELRVFLEEWLPRIPEFQISPGDTITVQPGKVNLITNLPLVWKT